MSSRASRLFLPGVLVSLAIIPRLTTAQATAASQSSSSSSRAPQKAPRVPHTDSSVDMGIVSNGVYHNKTLGLSCKIPAGFVLRTEEMNARDEDDPSEGGQGDAQKPDAQIGSSAGGKVLLAAFSRPPAARGEDINSSIVITAESVAAYPGLKEAGQYLLGPVMEIAKAQGFEEDDEPYEFALGTKTLARADFHKDVGSRVMHQSTLVLLARGWAVSITFIGGTEDETDELVEGLSFAATGVKK